MLIASLGLLGFSSRLPLALAGLLLAALLWSPVPSILLILPTLLTLLRLLTLLGLLALATPL